MGRPTPAIILAVQTADAANFLAPHRARTTMIRIWLDIAQSAIFICFHSSPAPQHLVQRTLTRFCVGRATVRVRLLRQRPCRTLFRIHCCLKKPMQALACCAGDDHQSPDGANGACRIASGLTNEARIALTAVDVKTPRCAPFAQSPFSSQTTSAGVSATSKAAALAAYSSPLAQPTSGNTVKGCANTYAMATCATVTPRVAAS